MLRMMFMLCLALGVAGCATKEPAAPAKAASASPPVGPRVSLAGAYTFGDAKAPVALVVYSDYQCPFCARFHHGLLDQLKTRYIDTGVLRYVHKDFPLSMHPHAMPAAIVARCAGAQGGYGAMQGRLYESQAELGEALYAKLATTVGLDPIAFARCRDDPAIRRAVERDAREGRRIGVTSTPTLMLGRIEGDTMFVERVAAGLPSIDTLAAEIDILRAGRH